MTQDRYAQVFHGGVEECRFTPGSSISIGRHSRNDIVIDSVAVSRFHATIRWDARHAVPLVYDNHSHNGTTVDGKVVVNAPLPLEHGAVLGLGGTTLEVRLENCDGPALLRGAHELVSLYSEEGPQIIGSYASGRDLQKILQRLEAERRTGTLHVEPQAGMHGGAVTICMGRIMAVQLGRAMRTRALQHLLELSGPGRYRFSGDFEPTDSPLQLWLSSYLRERYPSRGTEPLYRSPDLDLRAERDEDREAC